MGIQLPNATPGFSNTERRIMLVDDIEDDPRDDTETVHLFCIVYCLVNIQEMKLQKIYLHQYQYRTPYTLSTILHYIIRNINTDLLEKEKDVQCWLLPKKKKIL